MYPEVVPVSELVDELKESPPIYPEVVPVSELVDQELPHPEVVPVSELVENEHDNAGELIKNKAITIEENIVFRACAIVNSVSLFSY